MGICVAAAVTAQAAEEPHAASTVYDLAAEDAVVEEHTARILWNILGDNVIHESVGSSWYSSYVDEGGELSGLIEVDVEARTVAGEITEVWSCEFCEGWTYREATATATIRDGWIDDSEVQQIEGTVDITYHVRSGKEESPSVCGDEECYVCADRFCTYEGSGAGSASLDGWVDGDTLSLAFADRLEPDVSAQDFTGLERTVFFMSRFSVTITGSAVATQGGAPATEDSQPTPSSISVPTVTAIAGGVPIPGVDAGSPPGPATEGSAATTSTTTATSEPVAAGSGSEDDDTASRFVSVLLIIGLILGVGAAIVMFRRLFGPERIPLAGTPAAKRRAAQEAAVERAKWFREEATHIIKKGTIVHVPNPVMVEDARRRGEEIPIGLDVPIMKSLRPTFRFESDGPSIMLEVETVDDVTVVYTGDAYERAVLPNGGFVFVPEFKLTPLPPKGFAPDHVLKGTKHIQGRRATNDQVVAYAPGTPVQVVETRGDRTRVRVDEKTDIWVPRDAVDKPPPVGKGADDLGS